MGAGAIKDRTRAKAAKIAKGEILVFLTQDALPFDDFTIENIIKVFEDEISKDQLGDLPFKELLGIDEEFEIRRSKEAIIAKDADLLDQMLLLKEYAHQGNSEAKIWLSGKGKANKENAQYLSLKTKSAKKLGKEILNGNVSEWWENIWTAKNR